MGQAWRKLAATGAIIGALAAVLGVSATVSAFSGTTANPGNTFAAGTVALTDNDSGSAMFTLGGMKPGATDTGCVTVTSSGSLPSLVRLYGTTTGTGLAAYLNLVVTRGTQSGGTFDDCTGFAPDAADHIGAGAGVVYSGTLAGLPDDFTGGVVDPAPSLPEAWTTGETHTYRFQFTLADDNGAQGLTATQTFTWEARNTTLYSQVVLSDHPVGYWRLDETSGTTAADAAGAADGTYVGPTLNQTSGVREAGTAVGFDGNDRVSVGDVHDFAGTAAFTAELWMKPGSSAGFSRVLAKEQVSGPNRDGWQLEVWPVGGGTRRLEFGRHGATTQTTISTSSHPAVGVWHHVVATYDGTTMRLYLNGTQVASAASSVVVGDHGLPLTLGARSDASNYYPGDLDEVAVYSYALSAQQVGEHYAAGRG